MEHMSLFYEKFYKVTTAFPKENFRCQTKRYGTILIVFETRKVNFILNHTFNPVATCKFIFISNYST